MSDIPAWALVNTVSAYTIVFAGLLTTALTALMASQPRRWWAVYAGVLLTGILTGLAPRLWRDPDGWAFDTGTNLLLVWLIQVAVVGDYYGLHGRRWVPVATGVPILLFLTWKLVVGPLSRMNAISFGDFG